MFDRQAEKKLSDLVREQRERTDTPGVSLAVVYQDRVVFAEGFGVTSADASQAISVTPNTLFRIGSTTKPMTGTLLMRLVEAGKLSLDEPVVSYIPWLMLSDTDATSRLTLRHLMSHQSGLPWGAQFFGHRDSAGLETYVREHVPRLPLIAPPGVLFSYSNVGVNVAGCVAEAVGGAPFAELMRVWLFEPLGMDRTMFDPLRAIAFPLAQTHERTEAGIHVRRAEPWAENVAYHPSAMAYSTALDVARFARLHLNQGEWEGKSLLLASSVAEMQKTQVDEYQTDGRTVGLSFALSGYRGYRRVGHGGGIASFGSVFTMLPEIGVAVVLQFIEGSFWQATEEIVRWIFDAALQDSPSPCAVASLSITPAQKQPGDQERGIGTFLGPRSGLVALSVGGGGDKLLLSRRGMSGDIPLSRLRHDLYTGRNPLTGEEEVVGFIGLTDERSAGPVSYIMLNGAPCVRVEPDPAFVPNPSTWHVYAGEYQGPDEAYPSGFDRLTLCCENNVLKVFSLNRVREEEAVPWNEGCFIYRARFLCFQTNAFTTELCRSFTLGDPASLYERIA